MTYLILLILPAGLIAAFAFTGHALGSLGRVGLRRAGRTVWLRSVAALLAAFAAVLYTWGLLNVLYAVMEARENSPEASPAPPCLFPGQEERAASVVGYTVDYVPLRFVCETENGGGYATPAVPGYVNPAVLSFALTAGAVCAGAAALDGRRPRGR
ncbi:hypothetical protein ABZ614_09380 [Streptomyces sp. NPDC013178]|uniref:hypothetical protein n=1 Tax=unclassified Streptomyces TaxID=2593676 RepID=UPI0033D84943